MTSSISKGGLGLTGTGLVDSTKKNMNLETRYQTPENAMRSNAFLNIENKESRVIGLKCTKPCINVITRGTGGEEFGTCFRHFCTFAHSLEEWYPPKCQFNNTCRFRFGYKNKNGQGDSRGCKFIHDNEDITVWKNRTGQNIPDLPLRGLKFRKPEEAGHVQTSTKNMGPPSETTFTNQYPGSKSRASKLKPKNIPQESSIYIIRVPTNELAEIAIKAAFDRGVYNIKIELL